MKLARPEYLDLPARERSRLRDVLFWGLGSSRLRSLWRRGEVHGSSGGDRPERSGRAAEFALQTLLLGPGAEALALYWCGAIDTVDLMRVTGLDRRRTLTLARLAAARLRKWAQQMPPDPSDGP